MTNKADKDTGITFYDDEGGKVEVDLGKSDTKWDDDRKFCSYRGFKEVEGFFQCPKERLKTEKQFADGYCITHYDSEIKDSKSGKCHYYIEGTSTSYRCWRHKTGTNKLYCKWHFAKVFRYGKRLAIQKGASTDIVKYLGEEHFQEKHGSCTDCADWDVPALMIIQDKLQKKEMTAEQALGLINEIVDFELLDPAPGQSDDEGYTAPYSSGGSSYGYTPPCRHKPTAVFAVEEVVYYGGSDDECRKYDFPNNWLVVCCKGDKLSSSKVSGNGPWRVLSKYGEGAQMNQVSIDWSDYNAPPVKPAFWEALHKMVKEKGIKHVLFYCYGGHGRTGTALSATLMAASKLPAHEAVKFVREHYCKRCVESKSQIEYLQKMDPTENKVDIEPSK